MKLNKVFEALIITLFLTGCGGNIFSILDEGDNVKESELHKHIVTKEVDIDELVGTWKVDEDSGKKQLKILGAVNSYFIIHAKEYKKELDERYITIRKDATAKFRHRDEYDGKARVFDHASAKDEFGKVRKGRYLSISYRDEKRGGWTSKDFDYLEIDGLFYLAEKYETGDIDAGNLKKYYLLFKKVQ